MKFDAGKISVFTAQGGNFIACYSVLFSKQYMSSGPRLILSEFIYSLFIGQTIESVCKKCEMFPVALTCQSAVFL